MKVPASESSFPPEERLVGNHIAEYARLLQEENKEAYNSRFSRLITNNFDPTQYSSHVQKVKDSIVTSNGFDEVENQGK
jgi:large subunit ribosomal protein L18